MTREVENANQRQRRVLTWLFVGSIVGYVALVVLELTTGHPMALGFACLPAFVLSMILQEKGIQIGKRLLALFGFWTLLWFAGFLFIRMFGKH